MCRLVIVKVIVKCNAMLVIVSSRTIGYANVVSWKVTNKTPRNAM